MDIRRNNSCQSCPNNRAPRPVRAGAPQRAAKTTTTTNIVAAAPVRAEAPPAVLQQPANPSAAGRCYLSAYAKDFKLAPTAQGAVVPVELQRSEGGFTFERAAAAVPCDGYYMILWEIGVAQAECGASLRFGINQSAVQLSHALRPGYDSGQQVTWLNEGDKLSLQLHTAAQGAAQSSEIHGSTAQLTVLRLG